MEPTIATRELRLHLDPKLDALRQSRLIVLAVSGGTDSTALLHLVAHWHATFDGPKPELHVLTVDHGLRAASAKEVKRVVAVARKLGVSGDLLTWHGAKPTTGVQSAAREARYTLLEHAAIAHGAAQGIGPQDIALLTAHTADDQAETVLMRLARGSGPDGLGGMRPMRRLPSGVALHRPLLDVTRRELDAYLLDIGVAPIDDPSNADRRFERVRWRQVLADLAPMGMTGPTLASAARRTASAMDLLDALIAGLPGIDAAVRLDAYGLVTMQRAFLAQYPTALGHRLLARAIAIVGGQSMPLPLGTLEAAVSDTLSLATMTRGFTLHGAEIDMSGAEIRVVRELRNPRAPRVDLSPHLGALPLPASTTVVWDNRFVLTAGPNAPPDLVVGPLGADGIADMSRFGWKRPQKVLAKVLWTQPAVRRHGIVAAAPTLGYTLLADADTRIAAHRKVDTLFRR